VIWWWPPWASHNRLGIGIVGLEIDHQHAQRHADLDRGKADARRIVHRLEHVGDERLAARRRTGDGAETCLSTRIGDFEDFADSHEGPDSARSGGAQEVRSTHRPPRGFCSAWASRALVEIVE
jgi:hypothetical protein